ncbi:MAG TPA: pilus assembly protein N-terminal domain-containing protein [Pyrinomonadaceae bacterium]|nr:pilus assembly protein N-terminal domain-containing protein [Pyrinomonadaceae bacterium]
MANQYSIKHSLIHLLMGMLLLPALGWTLVANAQESTYDASFSSATKEGIPINVLVGQSRVINFDRPIGRFSISNPEIAEAVMVSPNQVLVNGKAFGQVNFIAWEKSDQKFIVFDVFVRANLSLIDSQIRALFPRDDIRLSQANGSVVLSGTVSQPQAAQQADAVVQAAGFKTVNMLQSPVTDATQVQLQVRVAEVSRQKLKDFGTSLASVNSTSVFTQGGGPATMKEQNGAGILSEFAGSALNLFLFNTGLNTAAYIRALKTNGALRALAEPNLIAMNGQTASFLAGGEFPVPVVQGSSNSNAVTVVFKEYGVRLNFKPTIIDEDHIRLELEPEVSTIDFANGVRFNGFIIPALRTRRARTGVELRDGQSFALAGLLDNNETRSMSKIPVIGDIPVLGSLFKSSSFQKQETELMFIITADLVKPVNSDELPRLKGIDGLKKGSPLGVEPAGGDGLSGRSGFSSGNGDSAAATTTVPVAVPAKVPATTTPAILTPAAPANGTPANEGAKTAPQPVATPGTTKGATP